MRDRPRLICFVSMLMLQTIAANSIAESWEAELQGGGHVRVDPKTNRGTVVTRDGAQTQLWDGVHRLRDGSEITVRSGVVVPNPEILDARDRLPRHAFVEGELGVGPCEKLLRKVCGSGDECSRLPGCEQARQLLQFEKEEREDQTPGFEQAPQQCREALGMEDFFKPCQSEDSPCQRLVSKVCGIKNECGGTQACDASRQLLAMETEERLSAKDADAPGFTSTQCEQALGNENFFHGCAQR